MRLLVTEFITGGGLANHPLPDSLKQEGLLMLKSVLADCSHIDGIELVTTLDSRASDDIDGVESYSIDDSEGYMLEVFKIASQCDYSWVIAPESEGVLESMVARLTEKNVTTINCDSESIRMTGDKIKCVSHLLKSGLNTTLNLSRQETQQYSHKVVMKNRFGVGCEGLRVCHSGQHALKHIDDFNQWVVQPYVKGEQISLSLLCWAGEARILSCNKQIFFGEDEPRLKSCQVNAVAINNELMELSNNIAQVFPGLSGYVGVDLIHTNDSYVIVDINPRLTSSYVGLSKVLLNNPVELCLNVFDKKCLPENIERNNKIAEVCIE